MALCDKPVPVCLHLPFSSLSLMVLQVNGVDRLFAPSYWSSSDWYVGIDSSLLSIVVPTSFSREVMKLAVWCWQILGSFDIGLPSHQGLKIRLIESHRGHFTYLSRLLASLLKSALMRDCSSLFRTDYRGLERSWADVRLKPGCRLLCSRLLIPKSLSPRY